MSDTLIKRVMEKDKKGVQRQVYPVTHVSAVEGLDEVGGSLSAVKSVNGKSGHVTLTLEDMGFPKEMMQKIIQIIKEYDEGTLGNGVELEKIKEE